jgi:hypothetical protein
MSRFSGVLAVLGHLLSQMGYRKDAHWTAIDGRMSAIGRHEASCRFETNPRCTVMLASSTAAGVGISLTAASVLVLMEPSWTHVAEAQLICRVYRIGQAHPVEVVRLTCDNAIEACLRIKCDAEEGSEAASKWYAAVPAFAAAPPGRRRDPLSDGCDVAMALIECQQPDIVDYD